MTFVWKYATKDSRNAKLYLTNCSATLTTAFVQGNSFKAPIDIPFGLYCWYVFAQDWAGNWSASPSVNNNFYITLMKSPKLDSTIKGDIPKFVWSAHPDAKGAPAPQYEIRVDDDPAFGSPEAASGVGGNVTKYTWPASLSSGTWYWQIRFDPGDGSGWQDWMPGWGFVVP